jgi:hypothetical protein
VYVLYSIGKTTKGGSPAREIGDARESKSVRRLLEGEPTMTRTAMVLAVLLAAGALSVAAAEEKAPKEAAKTETPAAPAGKEETLKGMLGTSADGKTTLKTKSEDKAVPSKTYVLWPDADTAKTLAPLVKKKADAEVTGIVAPDGVNVKVKSVSEVEKKKK